MPQSIKYIKYNLFAKLVIFLFAIGIFFFFYNAFLVDRSIESLRFSLSNVETAEAATSASYIAPLMQIQFINELSRTKFDADLSMALEYSSDALGFSAEDRPLDDVISVTKETIMQKELKRNIFFRLLDKVNHFFRSLVVKFLRLKKTQKKAQKIDKGVLKNISMLEDKGDFYLAIKAYEEAIAEFPGYYETPSLMIRLGYLLHKTDRTKDAESLYREVIKRFKQTPEEKTARMLLDELSNKEKVDSKADKILQKALTEVDREAQQQLYYESGLIRMSVLNLKGARESFIKAIAIVPDNILAEGAYLRLGICEKLLGNMEASFSAFKKLYDLTKDSRLKAQMYYEIAQNQRLRGEYKEAAASSNRAISECEDRNIMPILMLQLGTTYLFDLKDFLSAKEVFEKLRNDFPALSVVYPGTDFVVKYIALDVPPKVAEEYVNLMERTWLETILPKRVLKLIEKAAERFAQKVTEGVREIVILDEYDVEKGDFVTIDLSEKRLNNYLKKWFPAGNNSRVWDVSMKFEGERKLKTYGTIHFPGGGKIKGFLEGTFKKTKLRKLPKWKGQKKANDYLLYTVNKGWIAGIPIPSAIMNIIVKPSVVHFNKEFPIYIKDFVLNKETILFAGPVREDLREELEAEAYGLRHLEVKDADSGFIYGRRKESLGDTKSGIQTESKATRDRFIGGLSTHDISGEDKK